MTETQQIPTNPAELKKMKGMVVEMTVCLQNIEDQKDQMKLIAEEYEKSFSIPKKYVTKMARVMFKHSYTTLQSENEHFELLYESVMESKTQSPPSED
jgi:hypothetical protein